MKVPSLRELEEASEKLYFDAEFAESRNPSDKEILECAQAILPERTSVRVWQIIDKLRADKGEEEAMRAFADELLDEPIRLSDIRAHLGEVDSDAQECVSATELVWWGLVQYLVRHLNIIRTKTTDDQRRQRAAIRDKELAP
jgi:hypothetical protein